MNAGTGLSGVSVPAAARRVPSGRSARAMPTAVRHRGNRQDRGDRPDRDPDLRAKYIKGRGDGGDRRDRDKAPDPNSPFAKLAAFKAQLEGNSKEPN